MAIVTFTSDFGASDHYVAAMKAAVLKACPEATLVDVTHEIGPQDVAAGAFVVERAVAAFGVGTSGPGGRIIYVDRFGNATTNILAEAVGAAKAVSLPDGRRIAIRRTYADVPRGEPVALIGSSELLEIAVNGGSAAEVLGLRRGQVLSLSTIGNTHFPT